VFEHLMKNCHWRKISSFSDERSDGERKIFDGK
jgi:hypothetical protein